MRRRKPKVPAGKIMLIGSLLFLAAAAGLVLLIAFQLPPIDKMDSYLPSESTILYSADGKILARLHEEENRRVIPLSRISPDLIKAAVAVEDPNFYSHRGFDLSGTVRAGIKDLLYGRIVAGGSTITQQLARNLFLTQKKTVTRKLGEILLAIQIERRYTKEEIMELYLNQVYFGHNAYGVESAAHLYFGKSAEKLDLAEAALVIGLIRGPELYSPYRDFNRAKQRQVFVLNRLLEQDFIDERSARLAAIETLEFAPRNLRRLGDIGQYFVNYVVQQLLDQFGEEQVYHGGLKVYTTIDPLKQAAADEIISRYVTEEGPKFNFSQAALVSIDPRNGHIEALVGGADFSVSQFNRAVQARRQPGSAFKPFVYTIAMAQGITPWTTIQDEPTDFRVFPSSWNPLGIWSPKNFDQKFHGPVTVRTALENSLNIPSIKLLEKVGIQPVIDLARQLGINSPLQPGLALALGASEVTPLEITSAYGAFANHGIWVEPTAITKVQNRDGVVLFKSELAERPVIDPQVAATMIDLMRGVLTRGTGYRGRLDRPAAAKTGTTEHFRDAWIIGFVPQLVTGVWVGNDNNAPMKGVAEVSICPRIWKDYNQAVLATEQIISFPQPPTPPAPPAVEETAEEPAEPAQPDEKELNENPD